MYEMRATRPCFFYDGRSPRGSRAQRRPTDSLPLHLLLLPTGPSRRSASLSPRRTQPLPAPYLFETRSTQVSSSLLSRTTSTARQASRQERSQATDEVARGLALQEWRAVAAGNRHRHECLTSLMSGARMSGLRQPPDIQTPVMHQTR